MSNFTSMPPISAARPSGVHDHPLLRIENLGKSYARAGSRAAAGRLELFRDLSFSVPRGQIVAIVGQSGAGKSTLLHLLGALDKPTQGEIHLGSTALSKLTGAHAARFRNREVGYVWQFHYLLPEFTAVENVAMPLLARGVARKVATERAAAWLEQVGLQDRLQHQAGELSGGEQQRVSLARALVGEPKLLLADEPTGDLDGANAEATFALLETLHASQQLTTVLVTHNMTLARRCHRVLRLVHGAIAEEKSATPAEPDRSIEMKESSHEL
jgi:lipoprotein-releasing system ATP-binding protein